MIKGRDTQTKKALALILALTLCLAFAACGSSQPTATNTPAETTATPIETTEAPVETTVAPTVADDPAIISAWLEQLQAEVPQLTSFTIVVGDKNGEVLASLTAGQQ